MCLWIWVSSFLSCHSCHCPMHSWTKWPWLQRWRLCVRSATWTFVHQGKPGIGTAECPICQQHIPDMAPFSEVISQLTGTRMITLDYFHHEKGNIFFLLNNKLTLDVELPFLYIMFMPKLPSVNLKNALSTIILFYTTLLLIKELISQKIRHGNGPRLIELTDLAMFPTTLKQLAWQTVECPFEDSITTLANWQYHTGRGEGFLKGYMCFEWVPNIYGAGSPIARFHGSRN